jgi:threonine synthase
LRGLRETGGTAIAVSDERMEAAQARMATAEGIDACPEGGATLAALEDLLACGAVRPEESVVLFNTGAGWLYRVS